MFAFYHPSHKWSEYGVVFNPKVLTFVNSDACNR